MKRLLKGDRFAKIRDFLDYIGQLNISVYASHASFFITLAVFPMLLLLVSLLRYTGISVDSLTETLEGVFPAALIPFVKKQILNAYQNSSGTLLSLSALMALWSSGRGIYGLLNGLNSVYGVQENRGWLYTRVVSTGYTIAFLLVLLLTLVLHVFGNSLMRFVPDRWAFWVNRLNQRFFLLVIIQTAVFTLMYMALPNKHNKLTDSCPGAVFASVGWLVLSGLYSKYVENFSEYSNIYGSIYGLALSMLWLYCCVCILLYGGAINAYLTRDDTVDS